MPACTELSPLIFCFPTPVCLRRTVSADPSMHEECFKGAKFLLRILESIGCGGWVGC